MGPPEMTCYAKRCQRHHRARCQRCTCVQHVPQILVFTHGCRGAIGRCLLSAGGQRSWEDTYNASSSSKSAPSSIATSYRSGDNAGGCKASLDRDMSSLLSPSESLMAETPPPHPSRGHEQAGEIGWLGDMTPWLAVDASAPTPHAGHRRHRHPSLHPSYHRLLLEVGDMLTDLSILRVSAGG